MVRILFVTDLHKRDVEFTSITGYLSACDKVQHDILQFVKDNGITHIISCGDWYDKGYRNVARLFNDMNLDRAISESVNGNFYMCIGNHFYLERDANPELYLIQPSPIKPAKKCYAQKPVIRTDGTLQFGALQIVLHHYRKDNKNYFTSRNPETRFCIGVYHDEVVLPSHVREQAGYYSRASAPQIESLLQGVDLAIVGHIHVPIPTFKVGSTTVIVPGSLSITNSSNAMYHTEVKLPVIEFEEETNHLSMKLARFSTHSEELKFAAKKREAKQVESSMLATPFVSTASLNLTDFLRERGHPDPHIELVKRAIVAVPNPLESMKLLGG